MQIRYHGFPFMLNQSNPSIDSAVNPTDPKNIICEEFFCFNSFVTRCANLNIQIPITFAAQT